MKREMVARISYMLQSPLVFWQFLFVLESSPIASIPKLVCYNHILSVFTLPEYEEINFSKDLSFSSQTLSLDSVSSQEQLPPMTRPSHKSNLTGRLIVRLGLACVATTGSFWVSFWVNSCSLIVSSPLSMCGMSGSVGHSAVNYLVSLWLVPN